MEDINIEKLKRGFKGKPFNRLIRAHLKKQKTPSNLLNSCVGTVEMLPPSARNLAKGFIDKWNQRAYDREFWKTDTSVIFSEIVSDARKFLLEAGAPTDDETLFNMFQIVVLSYAYSASDQPNMRKFVDI